MTHTAEKDAPVCACGRTSEHIRAKASCCGPIAETYTIPPGEDDQL